MKKLNIRIFIWVFIGFSFLVLVFAGLYYNVSLNEPSNIFKLSSIVVTADLVAWFLFSKWAWKIKIFYGWLVPFPNLNGSWIGEIKSNWINPETKKQINAIPAILSIRQDFTKISCSLITLESRSSSFAEAFEIDPDSNEKTLVYSYQNDPKASVKYRSDPHTGSTHLRIIEGESLRLEGKYFNDRSKPVSGELEFRFYSDKYLQSLPENIGKHPMEQ